MWRRTAGSIKGKVLKIKREGGAEYSTTDTLKDRWRWLTGALIGLPAGLAAKGNRPTLPKVDLNISHSTQTYLGRRFHRLGEWPGCEEPMETRKLFRSVHGTVLCLSAVSLGIGTSQSADSLPARRSMMSATFD